MKLTLISPSFNRDYGLTKQRIFAFPPLNLPIVASLTPSEVDVEIVDENVEHWDYDEKMGDIVGITAMTAQAPRAYEIATEMRKRGAKVVLGGIHPTALPDEAARFADAVVVGEAESLWKSVFEDFRRGQLKRIYRNSDRPSLASLPLARRDLLSDKGYLFKNTIQVFRGCKFNCSFCSVSRFFGRSYRMRPVEDVVDEIRQLRGNSMRDRFFGFLDDNIVGESSYSTELFQRLVPLNILWVAQATLDVVSMPGMVPLMAKSGCRGLFIGLESSNPSSLTEAKKKWLRPEQFREKIKLLHDHGIMVEGAFIFGFDSDDETVFEQTLEFADKIGIDAAQFTILTPLPGTELFSKLENEGRIAVQDWSKYGANEVVYWPKKIRPEKLLEGYEWAWREFYSRWNISKRVLRSYKRWKSMVPLLLFQLQYRHLMRHRERISKKIRDQLLATAEGVSAFQCHRERSLVKKM
ncbi:MAG: B12-binding domain-containing radical SAM protein [Candidatus Eiseniibacteriota bacterium]|nr:MAG: B12-binding domain-containing radical SAM protein [Candidatus Eisenbacteria bacterium]